nr:hypothetical protein [Tanacetum cinerariifolium]
MVAYLSKSDASAGFDQVVDFLNAQVIQYALMINLTIYVSCIKQFWASTTVKKVNDVVKLRALIDEKRVVVTEDVIRQSLHLDDADGVECLPNEEIFYRTCTHGLLEAASQVDDAEKEDDVEVPAAPTSPSFTIKPSPPPQDLITTPQQAQPTIPLQEQPTDTSESSMTLLNTLMKTCATLSQKVSQLEQDNISQALEILKLKKRVKKLENKRRSRSSGLKRLKKGMIDDDNAVTKEVKATEPTVFDDEEVTMTMAQTLIKMKAEKARLIDEQIAKSLHDEEVEQAAAREKLEKDDLEKAKGIQQHYDREPVSIAQARKNMIIYLKNMAGYKMEHFRGMTYDKFKVEALQVKYPLIDQEIHSEGSISYWKIIRVGRITEAYQSFEDMLKGFDREDLVALWRLVKEKFSTTVPTVEKEKALWVELTRLFEPNANDVL